MKQLQKTFVMNADKCGNHTFTQIRREGNVAAYRRDKVSDGRFCGVEVFLIKTIKEGAALPGGGQVAETYEQYPGASAFGRHAWSFTGTETAATRAALNRFDILLKGEIPVVEVEPEAETEIVPIVKVGKSKDRRPLNFPTNPKGFSQKELATFNGIANYKEVYTDIQRFLANGTFIKGEKVESVKGKKKQLFIAVKAAA